MGESVALPCFTALRLRCSLDEDEAEALRAAPSSFPSNLEMTSVDTASLIDYLAGRGEGAPGVAAAPEQLALRRRGSIAHGTIRGGGG